SDEARRLAKLIMTAAAAKKVKLPLDVQPDTDKPYAKRKDEYGAMFLPDKRLTAELLEKAGKDLVPVALLWTHRLGPVSGGKVVSSKKLQDLPVTVKDEAVNLTVCCVGVRKGAKDALEMVLLSRDQTPVLVLPLEKAESKQELPIEFLASIEGDDRAILTVKLLGKYRTKLTLGVQTD